MSEEVIAGSIWFNKQVAPTRQQDTVQFVSLLEIRLQLFIWQFSDVLHVLYLQEKK